MDETTKEVVTRWIKKEAGSDDEYRIALEELKNGLGFSPLTGQIAAIGTLDHDTQKGAVYFQAPGKTVEDNEEKGVKLRKMEEKEMLAKFWEVARHYSEFVSFNGRGFDVPFIMVRSAVYGVRPTKDLMSSRYLGSQRQDARHIDLQDQLSFYGTVRRKGNLHLWCRAFSIESPKAQGITGDMIGQLFAEKKYLDIARYNVGDLFATSRLFEVWKKYFNP